MPFQSLLSRLKYWITSQFRAGDRPSIINVLFLMRLMGGLALALPPVLWLGHLIFSKEIALLGSISEYYYTEVGDLFVGLLFVIGIFLIAYKGFANIDNYLATLAGLAVIGVALFPTGCNALYDYCELLCAEMCNRSTPFHFICAAIFLATLMIFCFLIFTQNDDGKWYRPNGYFYTYVGSGLIMFFCLIFIFLYTKIWDLPDEHLLNQFRLIWWLESLALWAFGISWIVKSKWMKGHMIEHGYPT